MAQQDPSELTAEEAWAKAKAYCFDLLATRARSVDEVRQALLGKGYDADLGERLLRKLIDSGLLDDAEFANSWVRARHGRQCLGSKAIRAELKRKGVDDETAAAAVASIGVADEEQRARELVRKRLRSMTALDERTITRRLLGVLGRKGYSQGLAYHVIRDELSEAGRESTLREDEPPE